MKAWSNFRLMVLIGSAVTVLSLLGGALYVQTAISQPETSETSAPEQRGRDIADSRGTSTTPDEPAPSPETSSPTPELARAIPPTPTATSREGFGVACGAVDTTRIAGSLLTTCRITSRDGFTGNVDLSCDGLPAQLQCFFSPGSVRPRANGSATSDLRVGAAPGTSGTFDILVVGRSGSRQSQFPMKFSIASAAQAVTPPPPPATAALPPVPTPTLPQPIPSALPTPTFTIDCSLAAEPESAVERLVWSLTQGNTGAIQCLVTPKNGFDEEVTLAVTDSSEPVGATVEPSVIGFLDRTIRPFDLKFELPTLEEGKKYTFAVTGKSASQTVVKTVELTVTD